MARTNRGITKAKIKTINVSFLDFFAVYAASEGWDHIPAFHNEAIEFLSNDDNWINNTAVVQMFRNGAKSTILGAYIVWRLVRNPALLFLVQSVDDNTAMKTISDIQKIIRYHPMAKQLLGTNNVWSARQIRVTGATSGRNFSVSARGISSNITGSRADIIVYDDVEAPKNSGTADMRDRLRRNISESSHLLNPNGKRIFVGTPHSKECVYTEIIEAGASSIRIPFLTELRGDWPLLEGKCTWSERFSDEDVQLRIRSCSSSAEFMSQYQLVAMSSEESVLDPDRMIIYDDDIVSNTANNTTFIRIKDKGIMKYVAFWDPSLTKTTGDASVLTIAALDEEGHIYLHRQFGLQGDDEAQCKQVRDHLVAYHVPAVKVESNGLGAFLTSNLRKYTRGLEISVEGLHTSTNKQESILTAFATPLSLSIVHVHKQVLEGKLTQQIRDFNPNRTRAKDDWIDSASKAIHQLPVLVGRGIFNKNENNFKPFRTNNHVGDYERSYAFED